MRTASVKYETSVMKDEEVLLFVETAMENGASIQDALQDMRMIDNMMYAERLHIGLGRLAQKTKNGFYRKGSHLHNTMMSILEGRVNNDI